MISLSYIAWIGVVILQAIIHFVIIERRRKKQRLRQEKEIGAIDVDRLSMEKPCSSIRHKNDVKSRNSDLANIKYNEQHGNRNDANESDSSNNQWKRIESLTASLPVLESKSCSLHRRNALSTTTHVKIEEDSIKDDASTESMDTMNHHEELYACHKRILSSLSDISQTFFYDENFHDYGRDYGRDYGNIKDHDGYFYDIIYNDECNNIADDCEIDSDIIDDYDRDSDSIDNDEQWRYELVKQYYAPSSGSILTIALRANLERNDSAMYPVCCIQDSASKLNQLEGKHC